MAIHSTPYRPLSEGDTLPSKQISPGEADDRSGASAFVSTGDCAASGSENLLSHGRVSLSRGITAEDAPVAQRIEQRPSKPEVAGSSPAGGAKTTIRVGYTRHTLHCHDCNAPCVTTYRPIRGKVFRCPACRPAAKSECKRASEARLRGRARA